MIFLFELVSFHFSNDLYAFNNCIASRDGNSLVGGHVGSQLRRSGFEPGTPASIYSFSLPLTDLPIITLKKNIALRQSNCEREIIAIEICVLML